MSIDPRCCLFENQLATNEILDLTSDPPAPGAGMLLGEFQITSPFSFRHAANTGVLVYEDGGSGENDKKWQDWHPSLVYSDTYERHRDTWTGPKRPSRGKLCVISVLYRNCQ